MKDGPRWWLKVVGLVSTRDFSHSGSVRCHTPWLSSVLSRIPSNLPTTISWLPESRTTLNLLNWWSLSLQATGLESSVPSCPIPLTLWSPSSTSVRALNPPLSRPDKSTRKSVSMDSGRVSQQESSWLELSLAFSGGSMTRSRLQWVLQPQVAVVPLLRSEGDEHGSNSSLLATFTRPSSHI